MEATPIWCTAEIFAVPAFLNSSAEHHVLTWIDKYPEMQVNEIHAISDKHYKVSFFVKQSLWKYTYFLLTPVRGFKHISYFSFGSIKLLLSDDEFSTIVHR